MVLLKTKVFTFIGFFAGGLLNLFSGRKKANYSAIKPGRLEED